MHTYTDINEEGYRRGMECWSERVLGGLTVKGHGESHLPAVTCWSRPSLSLLGRRIVYLEKLGLTWAPICECPCEYSLREGSKAQGENP